MKGCKFYWKKCEKEVVVDVGYKGKGGFYLVEIILNMFVGRWEYFNRMRKIEVVGEKWDNFRNEVNRGVKIR